MQTEGRNRHSLWSAEEFEPSRLNLLPQFVEEELEEGADEIRSEAKERKRSMIDTLPLDW